MNDFMTSEQLQELSKVAHAEYAKAVAALEAAKARLDYWKWVLEPRPAGAVSSSGKYGFRTVWLTPNPVSPEPRRD